MLQVVADGTIVRDGVLLGVGVSVLVEVLVSVAEGEMVTPGVSGVSLTSVVSGVVVNAKTCALSGMKISVGFIVGLGTTVVAMEACTGV